MSEYERTYKLMRYQGDRGIKISVPVALLSVINAKAGDDMKWEPGEDKLILRKARA